MDFSKIIQGRTYMILYNFQHLLKKSYEVDPFYKYYKTNEAYSLFLITYFMHHLCF
jgi:hypothetical protein